MDELHEQELNPHIPQSGNLVYVPQKVSWTISPGFGGD